MEAVAAEQMACGCLAGVSVFDIFLQSKRGALWCSCADDVFLEVPFFHLIRGHGTNRKMCRNIKASGVRR